MQDRLPKVSVLKIATHRLSARVERSISSIKEQKSRQERNRGIIGTIMSWIKG